MRHLNYDNMTLDEIVVAIKLDEEERALIESIENDEWVNAAILILKHLYYKSLSNLPIQLNRSTIE